MPPLTRQNHVLFINDDKGTREITLEEQSYSIGRDPQCDIRLFSQFVSRQHATLVRRQREDGTTYYRIFDGNLKNKPSANGLLINTRKIQSHDLQHEDEVVFGPQVTAKYYLLKTDPHPTGPIDEFDITLISPNMMMGDADEDNFGGGTGTLS